MANAKSASRVKTVVPKSMRDLKAAGYNPRTITTSQKKQLKGSYTTFGDLSGIVFNVRTGLLVGGHQRTDLFKKENTRITKSPSKDDCGTVAIGFVEIKGAGGHLTKIPYREVNWDSNTEKAANIAANSGGGDFDMVKLGKVLHELKTNKFEVEAIPLDPWSFRRAAASLKANMSKEAEGFGKGKFEEVSPKSVADQIKHQCPKCGYKW